jgi:hypothetical protein
VKRHPLNRRVDAAQKTLDRFKGHPFKFGRFDCAQMVFFHLRAIRKPLKEAGRAGTYHSLLGGVKELKKAGHDSLASLLDAHFERIPPAAALVGDLVAMPGLEGPGALTVAMGNGRVLGYHEDAEGAVVMQPLETLAAWRVV